MIEVDWGLEADYTPLTGLSCLESCLSLFDSPHPSASGIDVDLSVDPEACVRTTPSFRELASGPQPALDGVVQDGCLCRSTVGIRNAGSLFFHDKEFSLWVSELGVSELGASETVGVLDVRLSNQPILSLSISGLTLEQFGHLREHIERVEGRFDPFDPLPELPVRLSAALQFVELVGGELCSTNGSQAREISHACFLEATAHCRKQDFMWNVQLAHLESRIWSLEFPSRIFMETAFRALSPSGEGFVLPIEVLRERAAGAHCPLVDAMTELGLSRILDAGVLIFLYRRNAPDDLRNQDDDSFLRERIELAREFMRGDE